MGAVGPGGELCEGFKGQPEPFSPPWLPWPRSLGPKRYQAGGLPAPGAQGAACSRCGRNPFPLARCGLLNCEVVLELLSRALEDPSDSIRMVSVGQSLCVRGAAHTSGGTGRRDGGAEAPPSWGAPVPVLPAGLSHALLPAEIHVRHLLPHVLRPALPGPDLRHDSAAAAAAQPRQPRSRRQPSNKGDSREVPVSSTHGRGLSGTGLTVLGDTHLLGMVPCVSRRGGNCPPLPGAGSLGGVMLPPQEPGLSPERGHQA